MRKTGSKHFSFAIEEYLDVPFFRTKVFYFARYSSQWRTTLVLVLRGIKE
jgi:hypothetical protein